MNSYEAIVDKLDELVENEPVDIAQIACDCKSAIEALLSEVVALQSENAEKDKEIERLKAEPLEAREDYMASEMEREQGLAALTRVEAERDAAKPSAEVLEAIDELVGFARPIMSTATWLGYVNVLNEWRGAQGEG